MISLEGMVIILATLSSLVLGAVVLAQHPRSRLHWSFGLGMMGFAAESFGNFMLFTVSELPADRWLWLHISYAVSLFLPLLWGYFVIILSNPQVTRMPSGWRLVLGLWSSLAVAGAVAAFTFPTFQVSDIPGPFLAARLDQWGRWGVIARLLATVAILSGLEAVLRTSKGASRWRIKYLVLGLAGIFLVRFYLLSHMLLFHVMMAVYLTTQAAILFVGNLIIAASLTRTHLVVVGLTVSRQVLYRSVVVGVLGLYLFVAGAAGWLVNWLGIPETLFWGSLVLFLSAIGLATILLSEDVRWRIKRFIGRHFYRSKYDYREEWTRFTKRLGSIVMMEELTPQLLRAVADAVGTTKGVLYFESDREGEYHFAGAIGAGRSTPTITVPREMVNQLVTQRAPLPLNNGNGGHSGALPLPAELADTLKNSGLEMLIPLIWQDRLVGLMAVGPERTGTPYTYEDLELFATFGEQAAGAVVTVRLSEKFARSREFEAFHRLTSFVIHDLKNSISALSMLSQNILENFGNPEFQRDAIKTLSKTADRMKGLLTKLSSGPESHHLKFEPVDLAAIADDVDLPLVTGKQLTLTKELGAVPLIEGDADALQKVIQNLATNAVEAMDGEGEVTIKTSQHNHEVVLSITDTGCGMSPEFLRHSLFTPFRSTKKGGWGIGLYQAKGIIESHGGSIEVASHEGLGTTFWLKFPIRGTASIGAKRST